MESQAQVQARQTGAEAPVSIRTSYCRMTDKPKLQPSKSDAKPSREDRLAEALRANLKRRKDAAHKRTGGAGGSRSAPKQDERGD